MAEWKATQLKNKFGEVLEISGKDYVQEVTKAGEGLWVVLHLYKKGIPLCSLINYRLSGFAKKFPDVKFIKAILTTCIPNYPIEDEPAQLECRIGPLLRLCQDRMTDYHTEALDVFVFLSTI